MSTTLEIVPSEDSIGPSEAMILYMQSSNSSDWATDSSTSNDVTRASRMKKWVKLNLLLILTMTGIVVGLILGFVVRLANPSEDALIWIGLPGEMFLRMLKMMILPLIISNVITGTASLGAKSNGKMGGVNLVYIVLTNLIACVLAVVLVLIINPGIAKNAENTTNSTSGISEFDGPIMRTEDIFADLLRNLFPENIVEATLSQVQTKYKLSNDTSDASQVTYKRELGKTGGTNLVGLILCAILFGLAASTSGKKGRPFLDFFISTSDLVMIVIRWFLWYSPIGIASLMTYSIASVTGEIDEIFTKLGFFILTVTVGLIIHQVIILPLILFAVTRNNPFKFIISLTRAWLTAFATTSGAMAIPDLFKACEDDNNIDKRVTSFSIPFTVTLNADGSALYIVSASMFIAQLSGISLDASQITILAFLTAVTCMALPSVPSSSIVTIVILLSTLGIPGNDIALLFTVEWLLDRLRTACNVMSHGVASPVVYAICRRSLQKEDESERRRALSSGGNETKVTFDLDFEETEMLQQKYSS